MNIRTRIAPSPTGSPHIGTLFQALINYLIAKKNQGQFIVRIEDTDQLRLIPGAQEAIFDSFDWAGITPDESLKHGGKFGPYVQSQRLDIYREHVEQLIEKDHAYYCFCSPERVEQVRKDFQKQGIPPMYDKHCRNLVKSDTKKLARKQPHVVRLKIPADQKITFTDELRGQIEFDSNLIDDQVILKSDGFPTYHLAVVVDDHLMEITHIVRGEEWISSTPKHILLYQYFNWQQPKFIHTPLLRNPDKSKLAKRHGHASVSWYRQKGYLPKAVVNFLASRVWNHPKGLEIYSIDELIKLFDYHDMHIQGPIVDLDKLNWINGHHIRAMDDTQLATHLQPFLDPDFPKDLLPQIIPLIKDRLITFDQLSELTDFFYKPITVDQKLLHKKSTVTEVASQIQLTLDTLNQLDDWTLALIEQAIRNLQIEKNWHKGQYFMMLRLAVTGQGATPPLFETIHVLGKQLTTDRLLKAQTQKLTN